MTIAEIKQSYDIAEVIGKHIPLKKEGQNMAGVCPFHTDDRASLIVNSKRQCYNCFACGAKGDVVGFFVRYNSVTPKEAMNIITGGLTTAPKYIPPAPVKQELFDVVPDQNFLPNVPVIDFTVHNELLGKPSRYWIYHNAAAEVIGYILRFDCTTPKTITPYVHKNTGWTTLGFNTPRPMYNLHLIHKYPNRDILLVEGEKAADAATILFPEFICTTWIGGADGIGAADFTPLAGRNVYGWADNDVAGVVCMFGGWRPNERTGEYRRVKGIVERVEANFKRINNQRDFPNKWDIADATWNQTEARVYFENNISDIPVISEYPPNEVPLPSVSVPVTDLLPVKPIPPTPPIIKTEKYTMENTYFKCLGFENINSGAHYVFYVFQSNVIVKLSSSSISVNNLFQLAPLNHWEHEYFATSKRLDVQRIANDLIQSCKKIGIFNPKNIRGRGAWIDNGVPVIHCGDHLIVDGKIQSLGKYKSKYIYEAGEALEFSVTEPLTKERAGLLTDTLERLNWARDVNSRLLAGWIVVAPLCGALHWRSHIWITGPSGAGKSEVLKLFVKRFTEGIGVHAQADTTAAGLRGYLGMDARPVTIDEIEGENKAAQERTQTVMELMRASSTSDGGFILKGTANGGYNQYDLRSVFAFSSVGINLTQRSDKSRITVVELFEDKSPESKAKWYETVRIYTDIFTDEYVQAFISRSIKMLPVILENSKMFSKAAAAELNNQRAGDQIGILLAGAYSLKNDDLISYEDACKFIRQKDWSGEKLQDNTKDEVIVINKLMDADIRVETEGGVMQRTVGELISIATGLENADYLVTVSLAQITLLRAGMRIDGNYILFSDTSKFTSKVFAGTQHENNYSGFLMRLEGATKVDGIVFGSRTKSRATKVNSEVIFGAAPTTEGKPFEVIRNDAEQTEIKFK